VYRGTWRNLPVAVKTVVFQDRSSGVDKGQRRAITEAAITSSVSHPNVVATLSYDLQPLRADGSGPLRRLSVTRTPPPGSAGSMGEEPSEWCGGGGGRRAMLGAGAGGGGTGPHGEGNVFALAPTKV
jgi:hypothetical protein